MNEMISKVSFERHSMQFLVFWFKALLKVLNKALVT